MAETVHLFLSAQGRPIEGESTQASLDRRGSIECTYFEHGVVSAREASTGRAVGRRQYQPIVFRKRIDRATPLLMQALCHNEMLSGTFHFYRPNLSGDGQTEQFYSVSIEQAYIERIQQISEDTHAPAESTRPPLEEVRIVFGAIRWHHKGAGTEAEDSWSGQA